jgi:hypothetical protein
MSESSRTSPARNVDYCSWLPGTPSELDRLLDPATDSARLYSLYFRKDLRSVTSAIFDIDNLEGNRLGTLQCYFPQSQTPADITVARWLSIVGSNVVLEVRQ